MACRLKAELQTRVFKQALKLPPLRVWLREELENLVSVTKRKTRRYRSTEDQIAMLDFAADKLVISHR